MTLAFDLPECKPSLLQRLDPRWTLAALLPAAAGCALIRTWEPALAALAGAVLLIVLARIPWRWYLRRLGTAVAFFAFFLVWLPLVRQDGDATLDLGIVTVSIPGLFRLLTLTAKLAAMVSVMLVLLTTAPLQDTFKAAHALRIPGLFIHLMLLTHRYVHLLIEEFARLRLALRVRGFRNRAEIHSYRTIGQVAGTLLVRSHERSERVAHAMRCRGFAGEFHTLTEFHTSGADVLAFAMIAAYVVGLLAWDWAVFTRVLPLAA